MAGINYNTNLDVMMASSLIENSSLSSLMNISSTSSYTLSVKGQFIENNTLSKTMWLSTTGNLTSKMFMETGSIS